MDRVLADWARERPDLDFTPVGVITRLARLRACLDAELAAVFAQFGLTAADFLAIVTLRRGGAPYGMPQARLMEALGLADRTGLLVAAVQAGSPAARAGIERGDLFTRLDGQPVSSSTGLALLLADLGGWRSAVAVVVRGNDEARLRIRLPARAEGSAGAEGQPGQPG